MTTPLRVLSIDTPASLGLVTEDPALATDPRIAITLDNAVYDFQGRVCAREGWVSLTTSGSHSDSTDALFEYVESSSSTRIISAAGGALYEGTSTLTDVSGTLTPSDDDWLLVNFNGKCIGVQSGENMIVKSGSGNFADVVAGSGSLPAGGIALSAWGRLWVSDSSDSIVKFSGLLDETDWGGAGAGSFNLDEVWPDGLDYIVGLAEWQDRLVIFGRRSILIYVNPADPTDTAFALDDVVRVGCVSHKSIQPVGNDLFFINTDGLHSLARAIQYENVPQEPLAAGVRTKLADDIAQVIATPEVIHAAYSPLHGFYLARIGSKYWHFDTKQAGARPSQWAGIGFSSLHAATNGALYLGQTGVIGQYSGYNDDTDTYQWRYKGAFLDLARGREVFPKTLRATLLSTGDYVVSVLMAYDYVPDENVAQYEMMTARTVSEWQPADVATTSVHEWGTAEWSGGSTSVNIAEFDLMGAGSLVQVGMNVTIDGHSFCLQRLDLTSRTGRIAA